MQFNKKDHPLSVQVPPKVFNKEIDSRWNQVKIHHCFTPRSNFGFTAQGNIVYLYGGYNIDQGKLDDLYTAKFNQNEHRNWQPLPQKGQEKPGKLRGHTIVNYRYFIICMGGQKSILQNNKKIYIYNLKTNEWKTVKIKSKTIKSSQIQQYLMRDSHLCFVKESTMYVFGGYQIHLGQYSNILMKFNLAGLQNEQTIQIQILNLKNSPCQRGSSGGCLVGKTFYIFGGTNSQKNFKDFWAFDCDKEQWNQIQRTSQKDYWPEQRKGAVIGYHQATGNIFMFGGLKTITKQQNDISIFMPSSKKWLKIHSTTNQLYDPSPTLKKQVQDSPTILQSRQKKTLNSEFKLGITAVDNQKRSHNSTKNNFHKRAYKTEISINNGRYGQTDDINSDMNKKISVVKQKKHRQFLIRKKKLLSQITKGYSTCNNRQLSPVSQCLNYSINQIGNQYQKCKTTQNQQDTQHRQIPKVIFDVGKDLVIGKKPCARDGHAGFTYKQQFYIIGGDRHNVSFNDTYSFRMDKGIESVKYYS